MLTPPRLPRFIADMYHLKNIEGVPTDEEVKLIHSAIRALNDVVHVPGLYDADVAAELSAYLFSVQMERYRDKYPCTIFTANTTYTPPQLPTHMRVVLSPVTNAPSNEEIKLVQTALRMSENLANVASMFDADLSMNLSQHLFDIHFGRYLRRATNREYNTQTPEPTVSTTGCPDQRRAYDPESDPGADVQNQGHHDIPATPQIPPTDPSPEILSLQAEIASLQTKISALEASAVLENDMKAGMDNATTLLKQLCGGIEDVKRTLVGTQNCMARGVNASPREGNYMEYSYSLLNAKGETPE
ncbi:hypothetical protein RhiJN_25163 [Ceratobasidium sp. AG-Ba]|nr:hypothetical protein RhiJN_25163 [Ceratobasidium sp. AG-Ba]